MRLKASAGEEKDKTDGKRKADDNKEDEGTFRRWRRLALERQSTDKKNALNACVCARCRFETI
jgi:hypothetical protein